MSIESVADWRGLRAAANVARAALDAMEYDVRPGVTTGDLDAIAADVFASAGARSAPTLVYGFPGTVLISINDEIVHGVPGARRVVPGDLVKLDVTVEKDGYVADAARTVVVARSLTGHGVGRTIHEPPAAPNYRDPLQRDVLTPPSSSPAKPPERRIVHRSSPNDPGGEDRRPAHHENGPADVLSGLVTLMVRDRDGAGHIGEAESLLPQHGARGVHRRLSPRELHAAQVSAARVAVALTRHVKDRVSTSIIATLTDSATGSQTTGGSGSVMPA
jgi:methionyl aminopeptidase